jgi:hypothetical protein
MLLDLTNLLSFSGDVYQSELWRDTYNSLSGAAHCFARCAVTSDCVMATPRYLHTLCSSTNITEALRVCPLSPWTTIGCGILLFCAPSTTPELYCLRDTVGAPTTVKIPQSAQVRGVSLRNTPALCSIVSPRRKPTDYEWTDSLSSGHAELCLQLSRWTAHARDYETVLSEKANYYSEINEKY